MNKAKIKYYIILAVGIIVFVLIEQSYNKKIDWTQSFSKQDKIPYGGYVLYNQLDKIFPKSKMTINKESFYEFYSSDLVNTNYIIINNDLNLSELAQAKMLDYINKGNNLFIAASNLPEKFLDTLGLSLKSSWSFMSTDTVNMLQFVNPLVNKKGGYVFNNNLYTNIFDTISEKTKILGLDNKGNPNFIKIKIGNGCLLLNLQPLVFTNFNILYSDREYATNSLSYLPILPTIWDEYYKGYNYENMSPLRYLLSVPAFKFAYYLLIFSLLFYIIFKAKRKQKAIPIITSPKNTSKEFIETIGKLSYLQRDNKNIAQKKLVFLLENIRKKYLLKTNSFNDKFIHDLSLKSGKEKKDIVSLFRLAQIIQQKETISDNELKDFNNFVEKFYS